MESSGMEVHERPIIEVVERLKRVVHKFKEI
jgi:hypothetical protein